MGVTDYSEVLADTLTKLGSISSEIAQLERHAAKLRQFFAATVNMLPDDEKQEWTELFRNLVETAAAREKSLKRAIYHVLLDAYPKYLTVTNVRDKLQVAGFDFTNYKSNSLASISTTLRRAKAVEIESTEIEGVTAFRLTESYRRTIKREADKMEKALADAPATPRLPPKSR